MNSILSLLRSRFNTAAALAAVLLATPAANAANGTWSGVTNSLWATSQNWSGGVPGVTNTATFNNAGNGNTTITVGTISLTNITFDTAGAAAYTLGTGADTITLATATTTAVTMNSTVAQNETINANLTLGTAVASATTFTNNSTTNLLTLGGNITGGTGGTAAAKSITIAGTGNTTIGGIISNGGGTALGVTKSGTGTLTLSGANTYTGATTVNAGTLAYGADNAISTGSVTVNGAGAVLAMGAYNDSVGSVTLTAGDITGTGTLTSTGFTMNNAAATSVSAILAGSGFLSKSGAGTLTLSGANTYTGTTTLIAGTLAYGADNAISTGAVTVNGAGAVLAMGAYNDSVGSVTLTAGDITGTGTLTSTVGFTMSNVAATSVSAILAGSGFLTKSGAGTLTLSGANTYTGNTTVSGGATLILGNKAALGTGGLIFQPSASTLQASTDLSGGNAITNVVTLATNTTVSGSNNITLGGNFTNSVNSQILTSNLDAGKVLELSGNVFLSDTTAKTLTIAGTGNTTISGVIANGAGGASNFAVTNTGVTTLTNANTYTGSTQVNADAGTLRLSGAGKIVGQVIVNAGTLDFNGTIQTITASTALQLGGGASGSTAYVLIGNGILNLGGAGAVSYLSTNNPNGGTISGAGGGVLNLNGTRAFNIGDSTAAANDLTVSAIIADGTGGSNGITKGSAGVLALTGANTYTGTTTISLGKLVLGNALALQNSAYTTTGSTGAIGLDVTGYTTPTLGGLAGAVNLATAITGYGNVTTLTLNPQSGASNTYSGVIANGALGMALTKTGAGNQTLSGASTYTGATTVSAGTLLISGTGAINSTSGIAVDGSSSKLRYDSSVAMSRNVTVTSGSTFAYNSSGNYTGTLALTSGKLGGTNWNGAKLGGRSIGVNQTIAPGNSVGNATTTTQTWADSGAYDWEINKATGGVAGDVNGGWDLLNLSGALTISATSGTPFTINITSLGLDNQSGVATGFDKTLSYNWLFTSAGSSITTFDASKFAITTTGFLNDFTGGGSFGVALGNTGSIGGTDAQLYVTYTAVPEPATWLLLAATGTFFMVMRRRRM